MVYEYGNLKSDCNIFQLKSLFTLFEIGYLRFATGDGWRCQGLICNFLVNWSCWSAHPLFQSGTPITLSLVMFNPFAFKKIGGILKGLIRSSPYGNCGQMIKSGWRALFKDKPWLIRICNRTKPSALWIVGLIYGKLCPNIFWASKIKVFLAFYHFILWAWGQEPSNPNPWPWFHESAMSHRDCNQGGFHIFHPHRS